MLKLPYPPELTRNEEAFAKHPDERQLPLDLKGYSFRFGKTWFIRRNLTTYSTFLAARFDGSFPVTSLQIGVFEGMDLVWQLQHTLKHPDSRVIALDPWLAAYNFSDEYAEQCFQNTCHNLAPHRDKVAVIRGRSQWFLPLWSQINRHGVFDYAIIDGDHSYQGALDDARNVHSLLKPRGWMLFDDVRLGYGRRREFSPVAEAVVTFSREYRGCTRKVWSHRFVDCYEKVY